MEDFDEAFVINPFALIIIATFLLTIFLFIFDLNCLDIAGNGNDKKHITFYVLFEFNVRSVYRSQTKDTMNVLMNGVQTVMRAHVERPAVLLLLAPTDAYFTALSLAITVLKTALVAFGRQWSLKDLDKIFLKGNKFSAFEDYWRFHQKLVKRINRYNAVVVEKFQAVHPQVSTVLCNLADDTFSPFPRCVIILVMDINDYFTQNTLATKQGVTLAESYLQGNFGPFLDEETITDLMRVITGRSVIVKREKHLENM